MTSEIRKAKSLYFENNFTVNQFDAKRKAKCLKMMQDKTNENCIPAELNAKNVNEYFSKIGQETSKYL